MSQTGRRFGWKFGSPAEDVAVAMDPAAAVGAGIAMERRVINPQVERITEHFASGGSVTMQMMQDVADSRGLPLYLDPATPIGSITRDVVWESESMLVQRLAQAEDMLETSKRYAERDRFALAGVQRAQGQVDFLKVRLERLRSGDKGAAVQLSEALAYKEFAGDIVQVAMLFRVGAANGMTQQAAFHRLLSIAREVAEKQTTWRELCDEADASGGVPYHGEPGA